MTIKVCIVRKSFRCYGTTTIQPRSRADRIEWTCPACATVLRVVKNIRPSKRSLVRKLMRISK